MGKSDTAMAAYLSRPDRCADFISNFLFDNKFNITKDMIQIKNSRQPLLEKKENRRLNAKDKYRDILTCVCNNIFCLITGIENQANLSNVMPVKTMIYDSNSYEEQIRTYQHKYENDRNSARNKKTVHKTEQGDFISGLHTGDKLTPVVTLVFYYGEKPWDRSVELYDMLDFNGISDEIKPFIQNYRINLIDIHNIENTASFKTDLGILIDLMKIRKDKAQLKEYIQTHTEFFEKTSGDAYDLVAELINSQWLINTKKEYFDTKRGVYNMCTGMKEWLEDVESDGFAKGIHATLDIMNDLRSKQEPEIIAAKYQVDLNDVMVIFHYLNG